MSKALEGMPYCKEHQGNYSHYAAENCEVCRLRAEVASLSRIETEAFDMLSLYGVPKGRAKNVANGIEVLATRFRRQTADLSQQLAAANGRIDALMLEHCPDEMTKEQLANWAAHQRRADLSEAGKEQS